MFTGIIESMGTVRAVVPRGDGRRFTVAAPFAAELRVDESVAVNGACMTVVKASENTFSFVTVEESLSKTTLGRLAEGDAVNLERALRLGARLDGHLVQGHIDTTGTIRRITPRSASWEVEVDYPAAFADLLIPVGSIAVDGVSLTVARLTDTSFTVAIIPHTYEKTTAHAWHEGQAVNLEFDMMGKYALRAAARRASA